MGWRRRRVPHRSARNPTLNRDRELTGAPALPREDWRSGLTNAQGRGALPFPSHEHLASSRSSFLSNAPNAQLRARPIRVRAQPAQFHSGDPSAAAAR